MKPPAVGRLLPPMTVALSHSDVVLMALATREFHPLHHDPAAAARAGHRAIFLNATSTAALLERYVLAAFEGGARVCALRLRLGVPHYAGDALQFSGTVAAVSDPGAPPWAEVEVEARNPAGRHAGASLRIDWS